MSDPIVQGIVKKLYGDDWDESIFNGDVLVRLADGADLTSDYTYWTVDNRHQLSEEWVEAHPDWRYYYSTEAIAKFFWQRASGRGRPPA